MKYQVKTTKNVLHDQLTELGYIDEGDNIFFKSVDTKGRSAVLTFINTVSGEVTFKSGKVMDNYRREVEPFLVKEVEKLIEHGVLELEEVK